MVLAPLTVAAASTAAAVDWNPLVIALAALIGAIALAVPTIVTMWLHAVQQVKIDRIDTNTNGAMTAMRDELAAVKSELVMVKAELAAFKATQPGYLPPPP